MSITKWCSLQRPTQPPWHGHLVDLHPFHALCPCRDLLQLVSAPISAPKLCLTATTVYSWMGKMEKAQHCQLCRCMLEHWKWSRFTYIYIYISHKFLGWLYFSPRLRKRFAKSTNSRLLESLLHPESLAGSELANQAFQLLQRIRSRTRSRVKKRPLGRTHSFGIDPSALGKSYENWGVLTLWRDGEG